MSSAHNATRAGWGVAAKQGMNLIPDLIWRIAHHLDVSVLRKLWICGLPELALSVRDDEQFWKARIKHFTGQEVEINPGIDSWRVAYIILDRNDPTLCNREDSVLAFQLRLLGGKKLNENTVSEALAMRCPRILQFLLSIPSVDRMFAPDLDLTPSLRTWPLNHTEADMLLYKGIVCGCLEIVRILFSYPRTSALITNRNHRLKEIVDADRVGDEDSVAISELLSQRGIIPTSSWLARCIEHKKKPKLLEWLWSRVDITTSAVLEAVTWSRSVELMQRLLSDRRVDEIKTGTIALELACTRSATFEIALYLLSDPRFVPSSVCLIHAYRSGEHYHNPDLLFSLLDDIRIDVKAKCDIILDWIERVYDGEDAFRFWSTQRLRCFTLHQFLEYLCSLEKERLDIVRLTLGQHIDPRGCRALACAARRGHVDTVMLLLGNSKHDEEMVRYALDEARAGRQERTAELLLRHL